jgi:hypothetical protein
MQQDDRKSLDSSHLLGFLHYPFSFEVIFFSLNGGHMKRLIFIFTLLMSASVFAQPGEGAGSASPAGTRAPGAAPDSELTAPGTVDLGDEEPRTEPDLQRRDQGVREPRNIEQRMEEEENTENDSGVKGGTGAGETPVPGGQ